MAGNGKVFGLNTLFFFLFEFVDILQDVVYEVHGLAVFVEADDAAHDDACYTAADKVYFGLRWNGGKILDFYD